MRSAASPRIQSLPPRPAARVDRPATVGEPPTARRERLRPGPRKNRRAVCLSCSGGCLLRQSPLAARTQPRCAPDPQECRGCTAKAVPVGACNCKDYLGRCRICPRRLLRGPAPGVSPGTGSPWPASYAAIGAPLRQARRNLKSCCTWACSA
jgi:hypothetical protein